MLKKIKLIAAVVSGFLLICFFFLFVNGSLEILPSAEQEEKAGIVYGISMGVAGFLLIKSVGKQYAAI